MGLGDILLSGSQIADIRPHIDFSYPGTRVIDAGGRRVIPGLIDQHVHVTGGGGESGFASRVPELTLSTICARPRQAAVVYKTIARSSA